METLTNACIVLTAGRGLAEGAEGRDSVSPDHFVISVIVVSLATG
ncbi:MAG: hypothetical protein Q7T38_10645 [Gallionella sp.]|nr:hypothetical protein [Gallionella sp.]